MWLESVYLLTATRESDLVEDLSCIDPQLTKKLMLINIVNREIILFIDDVFLLYSDQEVDINTI